MNKHAWVLLPVVMLLAACGGGSAANGGSTSLPPAAAVPEPAAIASKDEINPANALLVASIADRALSRYIDYREMTAAIGTYIFGNGAPSAASVACGGSDTDGMLGINVLSATAYDITLLACRTHLGTLLQDGAVGIDGYLQAANGSQMTFNTSPRAITIDGGEGAETVSGRIAYSYLATTSATGGVTGYSYRHTGQLDYVRNSATDQYYNLDIEFTESADAAATAFSVNIASLDIDTSRTSVSRMHVTTPAPIHVDTVIPALTGAVDIVSAKDGSRVQYAYIDNTTLRVRNWDSQGKLLLDVVKSEGDTDLAAAQQAAFN